MKSIVIGSRGSELALWQANHVKDRLKEIGIDSEIKIIKTQGDKFLNLSFSKLEGKGFFTKELEEELLAGSIDLAVHSHKDLPTESPEGLIIAAVSERETPYELLIISKNNIDKTQPFSLVKNALVGTSSARRKSQFKSLRSDVVFNELRGNVPTRIKKLRDGEYQAIILAMAGVERLNIDLSEFHVEILKENVFVPAPAQGVLALQIKETNKQLFDILQKLHNSDVAKQISVERKILNLFDGGCQLPLGVYCKKGEDQKYKIWISKADSADYFPNRLHINTESLDGIAEKVLSHYNTPRNNNKTVFITRDLDQNSYFTRAMSNNNIKLEAKSLISINNVCSDIKADFINSFDWIFFNSKNAVKSFFDLNISINENIKIGVMGIGSELTLRQYGYIPNFVGIESDTNIIAQKLRPLVKSSKILFPQAKESLSSIQEQISDISSCVDLVVYETIKNKNINKIDSDIIVFTSPSNVEAYFLLHPKSITDTQKIIAIGKSTAKKLSEYGYNDILISSYPDEIGLSESVYSLI